MKALQSINVPMKFLVIILTCVLMSCHLNSSYNNRSEDKDEAEKVTSGFFNLLKAGDYRGTHKLFSKQFFTVTDTAKLNNLLTTIVDRLGPIESTELDNWETQVIKGTDLRSEYALQYIIRHKHFKSKETFTLKKEGDEIKIMSYNVNSDGLTL